jgi:hypothetical protein
MQVMYVPAARAEAVIAIAGRIAGRIVDRIVVCIMYRVYSIARKNKRTCQGTNFKERRSQNYP